MFILITCLIVKYVLLIICRQLDNSFIYIEKVNRYNKLLSGLRTTPLVHDEKIILYRAIFFFFFCSDCLRVMDQLNVSGPADRRYIFQITTSVPISKNYFFSGSELTTTTKKEKHGSWYYLQKQKGLFTRSVENENIKISWILQNG